MATVVLPRSLVAILPGAGRRLAVSEGSVATVIDELETLVPGVRNRLCDAGPTLRQHLNVFVDGQRASLETRVEAESTVHVIPAVSGGSRMWASTGPLPDPGRSRPGAFPTRGVPDHGRDVRRRQPFPRSSRSRVGRRA